LIEDLKEEGISVNPIWDMLMPSDKELRVGCNERWNEYFGISFSNQREGLKDFKILTFSLIKGTVSGSWIEFGYTFLLHPILWVQLSDLILAKDILNMILDMKRIESKERLQVVPCSKHDLLRASGMYFDKVSDVIDPIPECYPNPVFLGLMLLQVALAVHRPNLWLGFFTFCFLSPFIQVS
jgi:hypothetical protein